MITMIKEGDDKSIKVFQNGARRTIYINKESRNSRGYHFFTGFDIQYHPAKVTFKIHTKATNYKRTFIITKTNLPQGKVALKSEKKKKMLNQRSKFNEENIFFHKFYMIENKVQYWRGEWTLPVKEKWVSSVYGKQRVYDNGRVSYHRGVDFGFPEGAPVFAANNGRVVYVGKKMVRGNLVVIDHGCGIYTSYWHLSKVTVRKGSRVKKGKKIGEIGETGLATGPHLHWDVRIQNTCVNGLNLLELPANQINIK